MKPQHTSSVKLDPTSTMRQHSEALATPRRRGSGIEVVDLTHGKQIAYCAGRDAGNRAMRKAGRTAWSVEDYNLACRVTNGLFVSFARAFGAHDSADAIERDNEEMCHD